MKPYRLSLVVFVFCAIAVQGALADLVAYWPLDGDATSGVPGGPDAVPGAGVTFTTNPADVRVGSGSVDVRNTNSTVDVTNAIGSNFLEATLESSFTLAAWGKRTTEGDALGFVVDFGAVAPRGLGLFSGIKGGSHEADYYYDGVFGSVPPAWQQDIWHHYALSYDLATTTARFYFDGALTDTLTSIGPVDILESTSHGSGGPFTIGGQSKGGSAAPGRDFEGFIDDVVIYDSVVPDSVIAHWARGGAGNTLVPEPASLALLGFGALALARRRRRRRIGNIRRRSGRASAGGWRSTRLASPYSTSGWGNRPAAPQNGIQRHGVCRRKR